MAVLRLPVAGLFPAVSVCEENLSENRCSSCKFLERATARPSRAALRKKVLRIRWSALEVELQRELQQPRIADVQHLAKCSALVGDVAIYSIELGMVPNVENVGSKFHLEPLS